MSKQVFPPEVPQVNEKILIHVNFSDKNFESIVLGRSTYDKKYFWILTFFDLGSGPAARKVFYNVYTKKWRGIVGDAEVDVAVSVIE